MDVFTSQTVLPLGEADSFVCTQENLPPQVPLTRIQKLDRYRHLDRHFPCRLRLTQSRLLIYDEPAAESLEGYKFYISIPLSELRKAKVGENCYQKVFYAKICSNFPEDLGLKKEYFIDRIS